MDERPGFATVDAAAATSWPAAVGPWLALLPVTLAVGVVALAVAGWPGAAVVVLVALVAGGVLGRRVGPL